MEMTDLTAADFIHVEWINQNTFKDCSSLKSIEYQRGDSINTHVFAGCKSLESVKLPESLTRISYGTRKRDWKCLNFKTKTTPKLELFF